MVNALQASEPTLKHVVETGTLAVVGACYDLGTGTVTFLADR